MKRLPLIILIFVPAIGLTQVPPAPSVTVSPGLQDRSTLPSPRPAPDAPELTKFLQQFLEGASRNDLATHDRFWADDLIYTSSNGRRIGKADIMRDVREEDPPKPGEEETTFTAEDIRIQQYDTTAIIAFRLVGTTRKDGKTEVANYLNTGTLLKRDGRWQAVSWQATKMPSEDKPTG